MGRYEAEEPAIIHNVHIVGSLAYIAYYTAGFKIVDVSNPRLPVEVAFADTGNAFGVYPFSGRRRIYVTDDKTGLWIFRFTGKIASPPSGLEIRRVRRFGRRSERPSAELRWSPHPRAESYYVYRARPGGPFLRATVQPIERTSFAELTVLEGDYEYAVTAVLPDGTESQPSQIATVSDA